MSVGLLDSNVLIALAWPSHVHHARAHEWFLANARNGWATCPITESSFVRISSNPKIIPEAVTPLHAIDLLDQMTTLKRHVFWPCDLPYRQNSIPCQTVMGYRQVNDAYLLGLAIHHHGKLVTFDRAISSLVSKESPRRTSVEVIGMAG